MFEGDSADTLTGKFLLVLMGCRVEGLACGDPVARTPIGASGNFIITCYTSGEFTSCFLDMREYKNSLNISDRNTNQKYTCLYCLMLYSTRCQY